MKKDIVILERLGTLVILGLLQSSVKIVTCTCFFYMLSLFASIEECLLLSISLFASENFHTMNLIQEQQSAISNEEIDPVSNLARQRLQGKQISFYQAQSLVLNTLLIILSYTLHPFATLNYMQTHSLLFRLFANCFFSVIIGMSWAFLASYSLKQSYRSASSTVVDDGHRLAMDNFDILMMVLSPIVSYLMAETLSISGLLALMCCAFIQSIYAQNNLEAGRSNLLLNAFRALSYSFRSICDIMIGISFAVHFAIFNEISIWKLVSAIVIIFLVSFGTSYLIMSKVTLIKSASEGLVIFIQDNTRGLLCFTLALQNFNQQISAIALLYIVLSSLLVEPILNYILCRHLSKEVPIIDLPTQEVDDSSCLKSCLLNLHYFTLSNWLVRNSQRTNTSVTSNFEKLDESFETQPAPNGTLSPQGPQQIELSVLAVEIKSQNKENNEEVPKRVRGGRIKKESG